MLLILADDLTGAADTAARCWAAGLEAAICVEPPDAWPPGAEAVTLTTDSRHLGAEEAAVRVRGLIARLPALPPASLWYKKIDSTLRGNAGAEIDALLDGLGLARALVCPAFPAQGRGVVDGRLVVHGARQDAHLPGLLAAQARGTVAHLPLAQVRCDAAGALRAAFDGGARLVAADGLTDGDLDALCAAGLEAGALLGGSAGLAGALAQRLASGPVRATQPVSPARGPVLPVLAVVGSGSAAARAQVEAGARAGARVLAVPRGLNPPSGTAEAGSNRLWLQPEGACGAERLVLCLPPPGPETLLDGEAARVHAARLADAAMGLIREMQPARLVLVGGDTAGMVLARLSARTLQVVAELLPGMPLCRGQDAAGADWEIVLKAGGHGDAGALMALMGVASQPQDG
jgi:uncharacterized protein YgbK (DUF1537 family)